MIDAFALSGAAAAYGLAGALLLAYLTGRASRPPSAGVAVLAAAGALHLLHDAWRWAHGAGPFAGIGPSLSTLALFVVGAFLAVRRLRPRVDVIGAFIAPVALILLLGSRVHGRASGAHGALFAVHIGSNMLGVAALTLACAMAVGYLIQERQVKNRKLGTLFHRLPPLEVLDGLSFRCIAIGLPALTVGVITGHVVAARGAHPRDGVAVQQYFAMVTWALFAAVLILRGVAGWRGRRAAIGTILGFASAMLVLLVYTVRGGRA